MGVKFSSNNWYFRSMDNNICTTMCVILYLTPHISNRCKNMFLVAWKAGDLSKGSESTFRCLLKCLLSPENTTSALDLLISLSATVIKYPNQGTGRIKGLFGLAVSESQSPCWCRGLAASDLWSSWSRKQSTSVLTSSTKQKSLEEGQGFTFSNRVSSNTSPSKAVFPQSPQREPLAGKPSIQMTEPLGDLSHLNRHTSTGGCDLVLGTLSIDCALRIAWVMIRVRIDPSS